MNLINLLEKNEDKIIKEACISLDRIKLKHYKEKSIKQIEQRFKYLYELVFRSVKDKNLILLTDYIQDIARRRFFSGFSLNEVHTAINILEETIWKQIIKNLQPEDLAEALGIISKVLGAGKSCLSRTYVSLSNKTKHPTFNQSALFKGTNG